MTYASSDTLLKSIPFVQLNWEKQNDVKDEETRFIYYCARIEQVISLANDNNVDVGYSIHRWFNFQTSKNVERIFCENGATQCEDIYDHDVDLYINGIPFDIKLSVISEKYTGDKNLYNRENKQNYIEWLKKMSSQEKRKHTKNRLFVICDSQKTKCDFELIEKYVKRFMDYVKTNDRWNEEKEKCELIYVRSEK